METEKSFRNSQVCSNLTSQEELLAFLYEEARRDARSEMPKSWRRAIESHWSIWIPWGWPRNKPHWSPETSSASLWALLTSKKTLEVRYWKSGSRTEALTFPYRGNDTSWRYLHQRLSKKGLLKTGHVYEALDNWFWHKNWSSEKKNAGLATYANLPLWISIYRINTVLDPLEIVSGLTSIIPYKFLKGKSNGYLCP